jgi:hypothetical protein
MRSPLSSFYFQHLGGAIGRPGPDAAAFGDRDAVFDLTILTVWQDPAEDGEQIAWARDFHVAMQPHATGVYVNNLGVEGGQTASAPPTHVLGRVQGPLRPGQRLPPQPRTSRRAEA